ncbi:MAG: hypothetical protein WCO65_02900 [bacterium]
MKNLLSKVNFVYKGYVYELEIFRDTTSGVKNLIELKESSIQKIFKDANDLLRPIVFLKIKKLKNVELVVKKFSFDQDTVKSVSFGTAELEKSEFRRKFFNFEEFVRIHFQKEIDQLILDDVLMLFCVFCFDEYLKEIKKHEKGGFLYYFQPAKNGGMPEDGDTAYFFMWQELPVEEEK